MHFKHFGSQGMTFTTKWKEKNPTHQLQDEKWARLKKPQKTKKKKKEVKKTGERDT